jgi:hypothetical protein
MQIVTKKKISMIAVATILLFVGAGFLELAEARSRGGGRSFQRSPRLQSLLNSPNPVKQPQIRLQAPWEVLLPVVWPAESWEVFWVACFLEEWPMEWVPVVG